MEQSDTATRSDKTPAQQSDSVAEPGGANDLASTGAALFSRGVAALQAKRAVEAVELLNKAISVRRARPLYHFKLGQALQAAGRLDEAAEAFASSIGLKPDLLCGMYSRKETQTQVKSPLVIESRFQQLRTE